VHAVAAGVLGAIVALSVGELSLAVLDSPVSLVTAVGNAFVDAFAADLKDVAVELFGTNDKVALVAGIVVVSLGVAGGLALASRRWLPSAPLGIALFGALGGWAVATDPQGRVGDGIVSGIAAVSAGIAVFLAIWSLAGHGRMLASGTTDGDADTGVGTSAASGSGLGRRRLLLTAGGVVLASGGVTLLARRLREADSVAATRRSIVLPRPGRTTAVPSTQSFSVRGLTPLVTPNSDFYRIDTALLTPQVDVDGWRLDVVGLVERRVSIDYDELLRLESIEVPVTLQCVSNEVGGDLVGTAVWQGVPLRALLERAGVERDAGQIVGRSVDGFTAGFPLGVALDGRTALVAYAMNGEPLPAEHGFPARLVVAGLYGYVSATKWLRQIELTTWDAFDGYWISRGWAKEGPIKTQSRIDVPNGSIAAGRQAIAGVAWAPNVGIERVEVQIDDGGWIACELGRVPNDDTWVQWYVAWDATPGTHVLRVRATDRSGASQTGDSRPPAPDGATGWHTRRVRVT
jgi:DMSO/TMAO reductase YedYZ molybdopterin-dependent catalytic subunit